MPGGELAFVFRPGAFGPGHGTRDTLFLLFPRGIGMRAFIQANQDVRAIAKLKLHAFFGGEEELTF